jgi:hypothetical protein
MVFHLEHLSKEELKKFAEIYTGGNSAKLMNQAVEFYILCQLRKDRGLLRYLEARLEYEPKGNKKSGAEMGDFLKKLARE